MTTVTDNLVDELVLDGFRYLRPRSAPGGLVATSGSGPSFDSDYGDAHYGAISTFVDPIARQTVRGGPVSFIRRRMAAAIRDVRAGGTFLDLGAGQLNVLRALLLAGIRPDHATCVDIDGPWSGDGEMPGNGHHRTSTLVTGTRRLGIDELRSPAINLPPSLDLVQWDFNAPIWPFAPSSVNIMTWCMAAGYVRGPVRDAFMAHAYATLRPGGRLLVGDRFVATHGRESCAMADAPPFPDAPAEAPEPFSDFLARAHRTGFILDHTADQLRRGGEFNVHQLSEGLDHPQATLAVTRSISYTVLLRPFLGDDLCNRSSNQNGPPRVLLGRARHVNG